MSFNIKYISAHYFIYFKGLLKEDACEENELDDEKSIRRNMFNAKLLLEGYGQLMTIQPNSRYANLFVHFQREAREASKGLWGKLPE